MGVAKGLPYTFSVVADELARVQAMIEQELSDCSEPVSGLVRHIGAGRGKMIRPALVLLSGLSCGGITEEHVRAAAIVEMIHNATLLHDDVVDEGTSRRGVPTLNRLCGNESAVLLGDFLLSKVLRLCVGLDGRMAKMIASAAARTCEGELRQIAQRGNWQISESEYIGIIAEKTAALFGAACGLGAMLAGASEPQMQILSDYGRNTGIAFQITDDLLDLTGDRNKTGKSVGSDLDKGKLTLPMIHLLDTAGVKAGKTLHANRRQRAKLLTCLRNNGCLAYAQNRAQEFAQRAIAALGGIGENAGREALIETARFVVRRTA